jgi:RNA polymerase sigma-70 factor, ECF subfamily
VPFCLLRRDRAPRNEAAVDPVNCLPTFSFDRTPRDRQGSLYRDALSAADSAARSVLRSLVPATQPQPPAARIDAPSDAAARADEYRLRASAAMERYARGDDRAFDELYGLLAPRLYRLCIYLIGRGEAEELLQEVFLKMHRARESFVPGGSVVAWSFAIARTTCVDRMRRKKRRPENVMEQEQLEAHAASSADCPESASTGRALEGVLEARLETLSESLRSAYVLVKIEGLSCAEAGALLGATSSAVKQRVHRASEELKLGLVEAGW